MILVAIVIASTLLIAAFCLESAEARQERERKERVGQWIRNRR